MNEELQKQLAETLSRLTAAAGDATSWAGAQIPPLVQEKIFLGRIVETVWLVLFTVWMLLMFHCARRSLGWASRMLKEDEDYLPAFIVPIVAGVVGFLPWALQLNECATAWLAPRLYILEWLRGMVTR